MSDAHDGHRESDAETGRRRHIAGSGRPPRQLQNDDGMLRALFNAVTESILLFDPESIVLMLNETAAQRFGKTAVEMVGMSMADIVPPDVYKDRMRHLAEVVSTRRAVRFEDKRGAELGHKHVSGGG